MDNPPMPPRELNAVGRKTGPTRRVSPPEAPTNQRGWYERLGRPGSRSLDLPIGTEWNRWVGGVEIVLQAAYGNSEMRTDEPRDHESPSIKPGILPLPSRVCVLSCISIHTRFPRKHHTSTTANMRFQTALAVIGLSSLPATQAISGKSYTGWDCCKPACAWSANLKNVQFVPLLFFISCQLLVLTTPRGSAKVCDINNNPLANGLNAQSGCNAGTGYLCDTYVPTPVSDALSYGFAVMGSGSCCKCFQVTWWDGNARGKQMIVQAVNQFDVTGDLKKDDIVILTPGGGNGPNEAGCRNQYGRNWYVKNKGKGGGQRNKERKC